MVRWRPKGGDLLCFFVINRCAFVHDGSERVNNGTQCTNFAKEKHPSEPRKEWLPSSPTRRRIFNQSRFAGANLFEISSKILGIDLLLVSGPANIEFKLLETRRVRGISR